MEGLTEVVAKLANKPSHVPHKAECFKYYNYNHSHNLNHRCPIR